jgi:hypothetical protein
VKELQELLTAQQCPIYGAKAELQQRLVQALVSNDRKEKVSDGESQIKPSKVALKDG